MRRKERGQVSKVIVTGCLAQRYGSDLAKEIPEVDAFLGIESGPAIGNVVFGARPRQINLVETVADKYPLIPQARLRATATPWTAYLKDLRRPATISLHILRHPRHSRQASLQTD